jgi:hypothetical protein
MSKTIIEYPKYEAQFVVGIILIVLGFLFFASLISWQSGSSQDNQYGSGSSYASSGNLGELIWEIIIILIILLGAYLVFHYKALEQAVERIIAENNNNNNIGRQMMGPVESIRAILKNTNVKTATISYEYEDNEDDENDKTS